MTWVRIPSSALVRSIIIDIQGEHNKALLNELRMKSDITWHDACDVAPGDFILTVSVRGDVWRDESSKLTLHYCLVISTLEVTSVDDPKNRGYLGRVIELTFIENGAVKQQTFSYDGKVRCIKAR